ncbi:MAG: hypothetical protein H6679_04665 [Epsilonproteobacteria bacterium]|nr:hypothetical protein [Campylobacterota bacterium]
MKPQTNEFSRLTIDIPKQDHKRLKALALVTGKSMRQLVIDSIEHLYTEKKPNKTTCQAIKDTEQKKNLVKAKNIDDLFEKLGI